MEIIIYDHQIFGVNRNKAENYSDSLVYKAKDGMHQINFEECAKNFQEVYPLSSGRCIGERDSQKGFVILFTNGIKTKIVFKKWYVSRSKNYLLHGTKRNRFFQLQALLAQTKYTTYDLT